MDILNTKIKNVLQEKTTKVRPENIKSGINILGISGNVVELNGETKTVTPTTSQQTITPSTGKNAITEVTVNAVTSAIDNNIQAENIKDGVSILGVTGSYSGGSSVDYGKLSEIDQAINDMVDYFNNRIKTVQNEYEALTDESVTLYTPNINYKYYIIQKRNSGNYRVAWMQGPRKVDNINIYPFVATNGTIYKTGEKLNAATDYRLNNAEYDTVYISSEYSDIETCIQKMKNNELTYSSINNYMAYLPDSPVKIPIANVGLYYFIKGNNYYPTDDEFIIPKKISSNENFVQI